MDNTEEMLRMDEKERREFGLEIKAMRKGQNLTQQELADRAGGVSLRTIRNLEAGRVELQPGNLAKVLDALGYKREERPWDDSVDAFLQMVGWRISRLNPQERADLISKVTLLVISETRNEGPE